MFTGIITFTAVVVQFEPRVGYWSLGLECSSNAGNNLSLGSSIAVDGVCLTLVAQEKNCLYFDVIAETMNCTSFSRLEIGDVINGERAARFGDEIGGHILSGHVQTTATLVNINQIHQQYTLTCQINDQWFPYIFTKGYIALAGTSLTIGDVDTKRRTFDVHLIPETLRRTNLGQKPIGGLINIEIDHQTQVIVDSIIKYRHLLTDHPN
jgi:riboflavin synthase